MSGVGEGVAVGAGVREAEGLGGASAQGDGQHGAEQERAYFFHRDYLLLLAGQAPSRMRAASRTGTVLLWLTVS